ncbi:MAG: hypothetical protein NC236_02590 [Mycoplasma sp.]|nr:hypothetical protein [Mycoplasma sp.]
MKSLEERNRVVELFDKYKGFLTQTQRQAIHLYFLEDLTMSEISEITASSRAAINDAIKKAIAKLEDTERKINFK